jgi:putative heme iron utilization protein
MTDKPTSPIRPTDAEAIELAQGLIGDARFAALGVVDPDTAYPMVSRVAVAPDGAGGLFTLISDLSHHTRALTADPRCSVLVGEPGAKGDPLTHPRLTLIADAEFVARDAPAFAQMRDDYLAANPKAKLYIDFLDFRFARFIVVSAHLNGGFGKAYVLRPAELSRTAP